jgi:hypothetical protein
MQEWLKVEKLHALTSEYKFISTELAEMKNCWERTQDVMCTEKHQQILETKLNNLWQEILWVTSSNL